ncbi:unnamed protein product [Pocillopora meandrina]|uniref:Protein kinase domain-containing protein n=1 Tax=Pocillopora meandrina TaxID=46732 RepID=A0AAU9XGS8_9CNID|nr:unnamed protein product [Pocillopora meandrina]
MSTLRRVRSIKYSSAEIYIKRADGGNVVTTIGSDVTLEWSCRVRGNHSVGMLAWTLKLHTVTDRTRIAWVYYTPERFWIGITKSIHYGRRVRWTGEASQGKISFVIQDVRISDAQSYKLSWKVILPSRNGSRQVVMTQSKLMVTVAAKSTYKPSPSHVDMQPKTTGIILSTSSQTAATLDEANTEAAFLSTKAMAVSPKRSDMGDLPRSKKPDHFAALLIFTITSAIVIVVLSVIIFGFCWKMRKGKDEKGKLTGISSNLQREVELTHVPRPAQIQGEVEEDTRAEQDEIVDTSPPTLFPRARRSSRWEFPKTRLQIREVFGQGAFGQVAKGLALQIAGKANWTEVAVKMLKEDAEESDRRDLLSELSIMKKLPHHRHVVTLLGCVTTSVNPLVIVEFASHGDLLGYLLKSRGLPDTYYNTCKKLTRVTAKKLMMFAWQIASGMNFLCENKVVHRDLAARNVLVADGNVCKITDFGMARDVQGSNIYTMKAGGRIPAKWTAYEALSYGIYTTQSDVWSYGIVLYEIFTLGGEPYPGIKARDIANLLEKGFRMRRPRQLDKELFSVMFSCWNEDPKKRPTFGTLQEALEKIEKEQTGYLNLQSFVDFSYVNICEARKVKEEFII